MLYFIVGSVFLFQVLSIPIPTKPQLQYGGGINALIHFNMATFFQDGDPACNKYNWNDPKHPASNPASFAPTHLNVTNWVESMKALGATSAVLTAKHGCGFLLWPTKTKLPDGKPYGYNVDSNLDVVGQFVEATSKAGIGHGFYYSLTNNFYLNVDGHLVQNTTILPNQQKVTQEQFEAIALEHITELWTQYGQLTEIWFDGGVFQGSSSAKIAALLKSAQPNAVAFNGLGVSENPVRWCGTESGNPPGWPDIYSTACCGWCPDGGSGCPPNSQNAAFYPSGVDFTLQQLDRWFYTEGMPIHPLSDLITVYHNSVGSNGHLELDFAIDKTGNVDPTHAAMYKKFGDWIRNCYGRALATTILTPPATSVVLDLNAQGDLIDRISMEEDQTNGEVVLSYVVEVKVAGESTWKIFSSGKPIGSKRIDLIKEPVKATQLRLNVTSYLASPKVTISAYSPCPKA